MNGTDMRIRKKLSSCKVINSNGDLMRVPGVVPAFDGATTSSNISLWLIAIPDYRSTDRQHRELRRSAGRSGMARNALMEARDGIEPTYTALQAAA